MKFNWGVGIFSFYGLFVLFILALVFRSTQENVDLVTEDYYQQEIEYEKVMRKKANANALEEGISYTLNRMNITVQFPHEQQDLSGSILVYRPSNKQFDKRYEIQVDSLNSQLLEVGPAPAGLYKLKVDWVNDSVGYYIEEDVYLRP